MTRRELEAILRRSLARMDLAAGVARALPKTPPREVRVIAIGKAAPAMARGALARWGGAIAEVLVVTTDGTASDDRDPRVTVLRGGHPLPDRRSVAAAERCLALARRAEGVLLVLVSGGASALVCAPIADVTAADKRRITQGLLSGGASIQELNVVRRHLSRIKGGGLARATGADVRTIVASDVIGGRAVDVGSGPSVPDPTRVAEARRILRRYLPDERTLPLARTGGAPRAGSPRIVASPEELATVAAEELRRCGIRASVRPASQAGVEELARTYATMARTLRPGAAIVRSAEPAIAVTKRPGHGGRSTHLATLVAAGLSERTLFLAAATDGVDGVSGTAGAIVGPDFVRRVGQDRIARALACFDTGPLHRAAGTALPSRPSGHNLADLHILVRW